MASFGFSIGDIVLVGNYAYSVYKSCKNAGDNFKEITSDVASLRTLLLALDDECKNPQSSFQQLPLAQKGELAARLQDCKADLRSVKKILHDFRSLDKRDARYRDRLAFTTGKQAAIREKIATHSVRLQQLLAGINVGTFSRIERNTETHSLSLLEIRAKLDQIHMDVLAGRRDATAFMSSEDAVALEDEVLDDHMTEVDVDVSYEVHAWVERVHLETSQPLSMPDNDVAAIEDDGTSSSSSNRSDTRSVQEPSNSNSSRNDGDIRGDTPDSSGDGSNMDEQNGQSEGVQESLESPEAPEGGCAPRSISDLEQRALRYRSRILRAKPSDVEQLALRYQKRTTRTKSSKNEELALRYQTSSIPTKPSETAPIARTLIDLRDQQWSDIAIVKYERMYHFDERDKCWVRQKRRRDDLRVPEQSGVLVYVDLDLEEVFTGITKYFTLRRNSVYSKTTASEYSEDIDISLQIKPGALNDGAVCYVVRTDPSEKHETTLILKLLRKPHMLFQDVGADIVHRIHLSSAEKKKGWRRNIHNIDGELILVHTDRPLGNGHFLALKGQGLPYSKRPSKRGLLIFAIGHSGPMHTASATWNTKSQNKNGFCAQLDAPNSAAIYSKTVLEPHEIAVLETPKRLELDVSEV